MLKLHHRIKRIKPDYLSLHLNAIIRIWERLADSGIEAAPPQDAMKLVNHGVRAGALMRDYDESARAENAQDRFVFFEAVKSYISILTPRQFMQVFPVGKTYDGEQWQSKDYFSTMEAVEAHGLDIPIGDKVDEFLWDYWNPVILDFVVNETCIASRLYREQTGMGIAEQWCKEQGIPTYRHCVDPDTGAEFMFDADSGRTIGVTPAKPRVPQYISLVQ